MPTRPTTKRCACGRGCFACELAREVRANDIDAGDVFLRGFIHGLHTGTIGHLCPDHQARFLASFGGLDKSDAGELAELGEVRSGSAH